MGDNHGPKKAAAFWRENRAFLGAASRNWKLRGRRCYLTTVNGQSIINYKDDELHSFDIPNAALCGPDSEAEEAIDFPWSLQAQTDNNGAWMCKFCIGDDTTILAWDDPNYHAIRITGNRNNWAAFFYPDGTQDWCEDDNGNIKNVFVRYELLYWQEGDPYETNEALIIPDPHQDPESIPERRPSTRETKAQEHRQHQNPPIAQLNFNAAWSSQSSFSKPVTWTVWLGNEHDSVAAHEPYLKSVQSGIPMLPGIRLRQAASKDHIEAIVHSMTGMNLVNVTDAASSEKKTKYLKGLEYTGNQVGRVNTDNRTEYFNKSWMGQTSTANTNPHIYAKCRVSRPRKDPYEETVKKYKEEHPDEYKKIKTPGLHGEAQKQGFTPSYDAHSDAIAIDKDTNKPYKTHLSENPRSYSSCFQYMYGPYPLDKDGKSEACDAALQVIKDIKAKMKKPKRPPIEEKTVKHRQKRNTTQQEQPSANHTVAQQKDENILVNDGLPALSADVVSWMDYAYKGDEDFGNIPVPIEFTGVVPVALDESIPVLYDDDDRLVAALEEAIEECKQQEAIQTHEELLAIQGSNPNQAIFYCMH